MPVGLLVALPAALPASADDGKGIPGETAALKGHMAALQDQSQQPANIVGCGPIQSLLLGPFVNVDRNPEVGVIRPNIVFSGANIHIVSGSGRTDDNGNATGLGNLIIGYDEDPGLPLPGDSTLGLPTIMQTSGFPSSIKPGDRGGSHNLVNGGGNRFTKAAFGGLVAGERNTIDRFRASVSGNFPATPAVSSVTISGGIRNSANGLFASVSGGIKRSQWDRRQRQWPI
jgi:hypothetical protein